VKPKPQPKPKPATPQPVDTVPRDSAPMPRGGVLPPAEVLERSRLVLAGLALLLVALGGGVVLGAGGRALAEARA
jgi:hypothetical protein